MSLWSKKHVSKINYTLYLVICWISHLGGTSEVITMLHWLIWSTIDLSPIQIADSGPWNIPGKIHSRLEFQVALKHNFDLTFFPIININNR